MYLLLTTSGTAESARPDPSDLVSSGLLGLGFRWRGLAHWLPPGGTDYACGKMGSAAMTGGQVALEGHWMSCRKGEVLVRLRFWEASGEMTTEVDHG